MKVSFNEIIIIIDLSELDVHCCAGVHQIVDGRVCVTHLLTVHVCLNLCIILGCGFMYIYYVFFFPLFIH